MSEEKNSEVINECKGEEAAAGTSQSPPVQVDVCSKLDSVLPQQELKTNNDQVNSRQDVVNKPTSKEAKCTRQANSIDFTADISLDQLDTQKEMTDEDVMHHLDVIEKIELDPETFGITESADKTVHSTSVEEGEEDEKNRDTEDVTILDEIEKPMEVRWYEKKIAEKETLVKERLSKLSRVLGFSYPDYVVWLEEREKLEGSICKLNPIRRCSLNKLHTNRWKFVCNSKSIQEYVKEQSNSDTSVKKKYKTVWCLEPTVTSGVNINNSSDFPSFVLDAVKIFEEFLQTTIKTTTSETMNENSLEKTCTNVDSKKDTNEKEQWLWLLVRCNSTDELMLFATGKNINRGTMDLLKQTYESGPGKNCNVKSLYCKSMNKHDDKVVTTTTFLVGAEALDEVVNGLKVQLAPKTNFWSNVCGAANLAKVVQEMLNPTSKRTVLEIGCGIGVIGLTIASKCRQVIGVDSPSEIEEAEMTCELNKIKNASFIMGSPSEVATKIRRIALKANVTYAIINANTNMGRAIDIMTCLRKIVSLRRIVMVTTLTKQSVRAILELARPAEHTLGHPFMPIQACVVDILPVGSHFEVVILMERRLMHRCAQPWFIDTFGDTKALADSDETANTSTHLRKNIFAKTESVTKSMLAKKTNPVPSSPIKDKIKLKREHSSDNVEIPKKIVKKLEKPGFKSWRQDVAAKQKNWFHKSPLPEQKSRENKEIDLREKLSNNRIDTDLIQKVNESRELLEAAQQKLSGPSPIVDATTAKELQNVLSLVLEQTNKLQTHLPRSVWDRIAPPESMQNTVEIKKELDDDPLLKGRFVQETCAQDIVITTTNKAFLETEDTKPKLPFRKYHNLAPLEPNAVMPVSAKSKAENNSGLLQKMSMEYNKNKQQNQRSSWDRNKTSDRKHWRDTETARKITPPIKRQISLFKHRISPPRKLPSKSPLLSPPRRPFSPPRRHFSPSRHSSPSFQSRDSLRKYSPQRRPASPLKHTMSTIVNRHQISPPRRLFSPNRSMSPPRRLMSPLNRPISPPRRQMSSSRRPLSPSRREMSPMRIYSLSTRQDSPMRRPISPMRYQISPERRPMSPVERMMSAPRSRGMMPPSHQSSTRHTSPHRMPSAYATSPPRRQQSSLRCQTPSPNKFADEWDIPSRGVSEQDAWQESPNERSSENVWRNERQLATSDSWQSSSNNDRYRKPVNQDKSWGVRDRPSYGNSWSAKQPPSKPVMQEPRQSSENRWSGPLRPSTSSDSWNVRGKESMAAHKEPWMDMEEQQWEQSRSNDSWHQGDKDDWNDLPEDARDPWGDEGNLGLEERWTNFDNQAGSSDWSRETDKGELWTKSRDSWQSKQQTFSPKPLCQNNVNANTNEPRWLSDTGKKLPSTNWQGGSNTGSWQSSSYSFQSQRPFNVNLFKDGRKTKY